MREVRGWYRVCVLHECRQEAQVEPFPYFHNILDVSERVRMLSERSLSKRELHNMLKLVDVSNIFVNPHEQ